MIQSLRPTHGVVHYLGRVRRKEGGNMADRLSIPDAIDQAERQLQQRYGNKPIPREDIVREVVNLTGYSTSSVMPSDFCYNRTNKGARPVEYCVFLEEAGGYRFVGRNYSATRTV